MKNPPIRTDTAAPGTHVIEAQDLTIDFADHDHDQAYALMERIADFNRSRWIPTMARIFDEFDRPGTVLRLGEIELDLGHFAPAELDRADDRLAEALRAALSRAIEPGRAGGAAIEPEPGEALAIPAAAAVLEAFEYYLLHGTWPYRAALDPDHAPSAVLDSLIEQDPAALVAMLRRRAGNEAIFRRLVRQMPEAVLARLLDRIDPASASYVATYFAQVRAVHAAEPVIDATATELDAMLWTIALRDALNRAGLRANRKAFVRSLIEGLALAGGRHVGDLYRQLLRALDQAGAPRSVPGSLLAILREILAEQPVAPSRAILFAEIADWVEGRRYSADAALLRRGLRDHPAALRMLLIRVARDDAAGLWARMRGLATLPELAEAMAGAPAAAAIVALLDKPVDATRAAAILSLIAGQPGSGDRAPDVVAAFRDPKAGVAISPDGATAIDTLVRLIEQEADRAATKTALDRALAADGRTTRARLRDLARADPVRLDRAVEDLPGLLAPMPLMAIWRQIINALAPIAAERAALVAVAATLPPATAPAAFARAALTALARARGVTRSALLARLAGRAKPGTPLHNAITPALILAEAYTATRREDALTLAAILFAPRSPIPMRERAAALDRLAPRLSGTPAETLRARLRDATQRRSETERLLAAMARGTLARLVMLLAPLAGLDRDRLRALLDGSQPRLAALVAALLFEPNILAESTPSALLPTERVLTRARAMPGNRAIAALLRANPLAAVELVLADAPGVDDRLAALLADPTGAAALFAGFAPAERRAAMAVGHVLTGHAGRRAIASARVANALAATLAVRDWRGGAGFAAAWLAALLQRASLGEQAAIRQVFDRLWSAEDRAIPALLGLAAPTTPEPDAPGGTNWARALLASGSTAARLRLRRALRVSPTRTILAGGTIDEATLARLLVLAQPLAAAAMLRIAGQVAAARAAAGRPVNRSAWWRLLFAIATNDRVDLGQLVARLIDGGEESPLPVPPRERDRVAADLARTATRSGDSVLRMAVEQGMPPSRPCPARPPEPVDPVGDRLIHNAGLVLAGPFLPRFFSLLDLTAPDAAGRPAWRSPGARDRAVHLTQMLVDGRSDAPEPALVLNRLLCGVPPDEPCIAAITPTEDELRICRSLLDGMIANWPQMANSSRDALQESFLQRDGRISDGESGLALDVERKVLDVLLSSVGWSYSMIAHPWMPRPLAVRW